MLRAIFDVNQRNFNAFVIDESSPASLVAARLRRSGYPFLWNIKCHDRNGVTVLCGEVPTFHLKQIAQELARHTPGVRRVENLVRVSYFSDQDPGNASG